MIMYVLEYPLSSTGCKIRKVDAVRMESCHDYYQVPNDEYMYLKGVHIFDSLFTVMKYLDNERQKQLEYVK